MMDDQREKVLDYLLDEMSTEEQNDFEKELKASSELRFEYEFQQRIIKAVEAPYKLSLSSTLSQDVLKLVSSKRPAFSRWCAAAAILIVVLGLNLLYLQSEDSIERPLVENKMLDVTHVASNHAVDWLVGAQERNGSWNSDRWGGHKNFSVGLTGLALLALNGHRETTILESEKKAISYLLKVQDEKGLFGNDTETSLYNHALATLALLELQEKNETINEALKKSLAFIVGQQEKSGGWGYLSLENTANTAVTIWQLNVLSMAKSQGFSDIQSSVERGKNWLMTMIDENGAPRYQQHEIKGHNQGHESLTAMSSYYLRMFESGLEKTPPSVKLVVQEDEGKMNFYRDFFVLSAAEREKIEVPKLRKKIIKSQFKGGKLNGSWQPDAIWGTSGGRVYSTAMAALSLQVNDRSRRTLSLLARH